MVSGEDAIVDVKDLEIGYAGESVLRDVTFSVKKGEAVTILGASGCGKSTLLKSMIGLLPPRRGVIRIAGRELDSEGPPAWIREKVGVLFQSGALLGGYTTAENVALPIRELTRLPRNLIDRVVQIKLDLVRLGDKGRLPPSELSGGMKRRAALARAMALDPEVLFCDEPAAGLDPETARQMDELLVELNVNVGITLVVVSHEIGTIENISSRCIMLDAEARGIIATGAPDELLQSDDPRVKRFFRRRLDGRTEDVTHAQN
jgi:phospholipid/cholesterol/gamma-HCH transport system ATP-binding protein